LSSLWFWYEQVTKMHQVESMLTMDKQTLAIAAALGDKKANKMRKEITKETLKLLDEIK